jgi:hypothetical protein
MARRQIKQMNDRTEKPFIYIDGEDYKGILKNLNARKLFKEIERRSVGHIDTDNYCWIDNIYVCGLEINIQPYPSLRELRHERGYPRWSPIKMTSEEWNALTREGVDTKFCVTVDYRRYDRVVDGMEISIRDLVDYFLNM